MYLVVSVFVLLSLIFELRLQTYVLLAEVITNWTGIGFIALELISGIWVLKVFQHKKRGHWLIYMLCFFNIREIEMIFLHYIIHLKPHDILLQPCHSKVSPKLLLLIMSLSLLFTIQYFYALKATRFSTLVSSWQAHSFFMSYSVIVENLMI
jgi:hypothetical protein